MIQRKTIPKLFRVGDFTLNEEQFNNFKSARSPRGYLIGFFGRLEAKDISNQQITEALSKDSTNGNILLY